MNILQGIIKVGALIILIFLGLNNNSVIFSYFLGVLSMLIVAYWVAKYKIPSIFDKYHLTKSEKTKIKESYFSYSWPLMFSAVVFNIFFWIDSLAIGFFKGASAVGFYNAAVPIVFLFRLAPDLFKQIFFPIITKEYAKKNLTTIKELSQQVGKWIFLINLPLFIFIIIFPGEIINILFGKEYLIAANALRILAIGGLFNFLTTPSYSLIAMLGRSKTILINFTAIMMLNAVLNIILVPKYGIEGAAASTAFSYVLLSLILVVETKQYLSIIPIRRKMLSIFLVSLIPAILLFYLKAFLPINLVSLILIALLFFLFYLFLIFITKGLDKNDLMVLRSIKRKFLPKIQ